ncbi:MAG: AraC family transcriptional regulator [Bacteroidetes bacterium]|nr:MAG: AraC family transcriptional regulator [Bacteroidota bacterium]
MLNAHQTYTLINPGNRKLAFKIFSFEDNSSFDHIQRLNYYSLLFIKEGNGKLIADFSEFSFTGSSLFCFSPYQPFMVDSEEPLEGFAINFHPDFFCIHKHQKEVACNGVLFNDIYTPPMVLLKKEDVHHLETIIEQILVEMQNLQLAQYELLLSYLKIFLITASRLKVDQNPLAKNKLQNAKEPFILQTLKDAIESHYKTKHTASDYASLLNISPKALTKITKKHFNKTLTDLISERIIIEAKRELYLTNKSVKEIAYELGYDDEYYFSRFFKVNADVSPQLYRETVGFARINA